MPINVFDFFSGCGGTSKGFELAGMKIVWAIDNDPYASRSFRKNFPITHFEESDISRIPLESLADFVEECGTEPLLFSGCAPCQPYSKQNKQDNPHDLRRGLLDQFSRFVELYTPHYVFVENVPGLQRVPPNEASPFGNFLSMLKRNEYLYQYKVIDAQVYGVPQRRHRLVLIASRIGNIEFPTRTHGRGTENPDYSTVREWIENYPPLNAGEAHPEIPNHQAARITERNLERLRHTPSGGDRRSWPEELRLRCHNNHNGHTDVYGRLDWDKPASCLTTKCTSISNGRFGHPEQDRAISAREAASLQTFPDSFVFEGGVSLISQQIGNAVPVLLAQRFGEHFVQHYGRYVSNSKNG